MPLINYYNSSVKTALVENESPILSTHQFELEIPEDSLTDRELDPTNVLAIHGIVNTLPEISYSTAWDIGPIGVVSKKIEEFTEHKLTKAFAYNNENFRPPIITDGWTQKTPKTAEPLKFTLEFRSYPIDNFYNTSKFTKILKFLIFATTPKEYELADSALYVEKAYNQAKTAGYNFGATTKELIDNVRKSDIPISTIFKDYATGKKSSMSDDLSKRQEMEIFNTIEKVFKEIDELSSLVHPDVGGSPMCLFSLGPTNNRIVKKDHGIKWMITDWSFKPALNVTYENQKYVPIYVDFKVSLESQMVFTNEEMRTILG